MKTKSEMAITKAMADLKKEVALNTTEQCLEIIMRQRNQYANMINSETGRAIRDNATGYKWQLMNDKLSSLFRKMYLLDTIAGSIYEIEWNIRNNALRNS